MNCKLYMSLVVGMLAISVTSVASAALITFSDRATFQGAVTGALSFEGFNDAFSTGVTQDFPVGGPSAFTVLSADSLGSTTIASLVSEGTRALFLRELDTITFTFVSAITAFGFDVNELNSGTIDYSDSSGNLLSGAVTPNGSGSTFFGAISDTAFTSFSLTVTGGSSGQIWGLDALDFGGDSIPEPGTLALFGLGLAGLGFARRRKVA